MKESQSVWLGFDPREAAAYAVARFSIQQKLTRSLPIMGLVLDRLRRDGLYNRPTRLQGAQLWDDISDAPMSTEFAISRFLVPHLAKRGWAMFADCDVLARTSLSTLFDQADPQYAVMCVKHRYASPAGTKMDGQQQTEYPRKNWSSVMLFNCEHPANRELTVSMVNSLPGRDLHRFCWLHDSLIGELSLEWNWLVGVSPHLSAPKIVHFTLGGPWFKGFEDVAYADEWRARFHDWAA